MDHQTPLPTATYQQGEITEDSAKPVLLYIAAAYFILMATGLRAGQQREETRTRQQMLESQIANKKTSPYNQSLDSVSVDRQLLFAVVTYASIV